MQPGHDPALIIHMETRTVMSGHVSTQLHKGLFLLFFFSSVLAGFGARQLPAGITLRRVDVQGTTLFTATEVAKMAGLQIGQDVNMALLEEAARTLGRWGYFSSVRFAYRYTGTDLTVTFQVENEEKLVNALFDNFTSIREEEILEAVHRNFPSFAGKVPQSGTANEYLKQTIEALLSQRGASDTVSFFLIAQTGVGQSEVVFRQARESAICAVRIEGANQALQSALNSASTPLLKDPYSKQSVHEFFKQTLTRVGRTHGYWRLELLEAAGMENPSSCAPGTTLVLRLREGDVYSWGGTVWDGNQKQTTAALDQIAGMRRGEPADIGKIEIGLSSVAAFYSRNGFIDFLMTPRAELDDQRHEVSYRVELKEGDQYRMGEFRCIVPSQVGHCDALSSKWKLRKGATLDRTYVDEFEAGLFAEWKKQYGQPGIPLNLALSKDVEKRMADVVVFVPANR